MANDRACCPHGVADDDGSPSAENHRDRCEEMCREELEYERLLAERAESKYWERHAEEYGRRLRMLFGDVEVNSWFK